MKEFETKLREVITDLTVCKEKKNEFGGYMYRSASDILEAAKPLLDKKGLRLSVTDDIVEVGGRIYVKATASVTDGENKIETSAFAREPLTKKGTDESQITGAASSYARKYALNGLFCIDDTKDADATNTHDPIQDSKDILDRANTIDELRNLTKEALTGLNKKEQETVMAYAKQLADNFKEEAKKANKIAEAIIKGND